MPSNAVWCGKDDDDSDVYVGRVRHGDAMLLIKIVPSQKTAYYAHNGKEHTSPEFEVLVNHKGGKAEWVCSSDGEVPLNAVQVGFNQDGKTHYVGRTNHRGLHVPGSVHPHYQCIYYPFYYHEYSSKQYEVLVNN